MLGIIFAQIIFSHRNMKNQSIFKQINCEQEIIRKIVLIHVMLENHTDYKVIMCN